MTIDDFIRMTQNVIANDGFDGYLPTLVLPSGPAVRVLEGVPDGVDIEQASREWVLKKLGDSSEDFFLAFRVNDHQFKVVSRRGGVAEERLAPAVPG